MSAADENYQPPAGEAGEWEQDRLVSAARKLRQAREGASVDTIEIEAVAAELSAFLDQNPDSVPALRLLADCAILLEQWEMARRHLERAERLDPWNLEILIIAESLASPPEPPDKKPGLLQSSLQGLLVDPQELVLRAKGALRLGQLDRAYSLAKLAFLLQPQRLAFMLDVFGLGSAADPERTRTELEQLAREGGPPSVYLALGAVCNVLGRYTEALQWLGEGLNRVSDDPYLQAMLLNETAYVMVKTGMQLERAVSVARSALETFPDPDCNGFIRDTLGAAYLKLGDYDKAVLNLREAVEKDPTAIPRFHLALAFLYQGKAAECLEQLRQLACAHPSLESPHVEETAILERVQVNFARLEQLLQLGGPEELEEVRRALSGLL